MTFLNDAFNSGRIIEILLVIVLVEAVALLVYWKNTGRGVSPVSLIGMLGAGIFLMLAIRSAIQNSATELLAMWLLLSLVFHVIDLCHRWKRDA